MSDTDLTAYEQETESFIARVSGRAARRLEETLAAFLAKQEEDLETLSRIGKSLGMELAPLAKSEHLGFVTRQVGTRMTRTCTVLLLRDILASAGPKPSLMSDEQIIERGQALAKDESLPRRLGAPTDLAELAMETTAETTARLLLRPGKLSKVHLVQDGAVYLLWFMRRRLHVLRELELGDLADRVRGESRIEPPTEGVDLSENLEAR